jgi:putative flavoprotein involved in K+ transport
VTSPTHRRCSPSPDRGPGRGLSLQALARAGVTLVGRPIAVDGERVAFDGSVAAEDAFAARNGRWSTSSSAARAWTAPPAEPDEQDAPVDQDPPSSLDLHASEVQP